MGTTAQKLTYLNTTKSQLKDMINYGLDSESKITNETTFREYVNSTFEAFMESLRNPDTLWTNLPKVTGTGTSLTLNNTANAPIKMELSASELSQDETPSPSNPQQIHTISGNNEIVISDENNTNSQTLSLTLGDVEVCKIGDYEDEFVNIEKNIFDKTNPYTNNWYNDNGVEQTSNVTGHFTNNIKVKPNTTYTISGYTFITTLEYYNFQRLYFYDTNGNWISRTGNIPTMPYTFKTPSNCEYINFQLVNNSAATDDIYSTSLNTFQLELGSQMTTYEPFGVNKWYLKKNIGKKILNGSENDWGTSGNNYYLFFNDKRSLSNYVPSAIKSNYFNAMPYSGGNPNIGCFSENYYSGGNNAVFFNYDGSSNLTSFKTWLGTHNTIVYYVLATPTYTLLNETLQNEFNNIQKALSYTGQTNITQVNNDLPFVLNVSALEDLTL